MADFEILKINCNFSVKKKKQMNVTYSYVNSEYITVLFLFHLFIIYLFICFILFISLFVHYHKS